MSHSFSAHAEIQFSDVLADPDNISLNKQYAVEQLAKDNLNSALSAIERVLILEPLDLQARLLRSQILVSLGNDLLAKSELETLATLNTSDEFTNRVTALLNVIANREKNHRGGFSLGFEINRTDNANSYPDTGIIEITGRDDSVLEAVYFDNVNDDVAKKIKDTSLKTNARIYGQYDLRNDNGDTLYYVVQVANQLSDNTSNSESTNVSTVGGWRINSGPWIFDIGGSLAKTLRENTTYSEALEDTISIAPDKLSAAFNPTVSYRTDGGSQYFYRGVISTSNHSGYENANQSDATTTGHTIGLASRLNKQNSARLSYSVNEREADNSAVIAKTRINRDENILAIGFGSQLAAGHQVNLNYARIDHDYESRSGTNPRIRKDKITSTSLTYQLDGQILWDAMKSWRFNVGVSRFKNDSNLKVYDVNSTTWSMGLTYYGNF